MSRPRVGFLGVGWIGRDRMAAIAETAAVEIVGVCEPLDEAAAVALALAPGAERVAGYADLLALGLDGIVIATPSALHAEQALHALATGAAVFCQKPLGRTLGEVEAVVEAARRADRLLAVDLSYRFTAAMRAIRERVRAGDLGRVYAADLTFHNAYGPDKAWFRDPRLSGGGCVVDLGVHLVDLALWTLGFPEVERVESHLFAGGRPLGPDPAQVEDYAVADLTLAGGAVVRLACSWNIPAGRDAVIGAAFHGTAAGAAMRNVDGSFHAFAAELTRGATEREALATPLGGGPEAWGGRAAAHWARRLAAGETFDPAAGELCSVAAVLDRIYRREGAPN